MTIQPINVGVGSILFLLSLIFLGPLYIAFLSLAFTFYMIVTFLEMEDELVKNNLDTDNHTIMTRSRRRLQEERAMSQS